MRYFALLLTLAIVLLLALAAIRYLEPLLSTLEEISAIARTEGPEFPGLPGIRYRLVVGWAGRALRAGDAIAPHLYDWHFDGVDDYVIFIYGENGYLTQFFRSATEVTAYSEIVLKAKKYAEESTIWHKWFSLITQHYMNLWADCEVRTYAVYIGGYGFINSYFHDGSPAPHPVYSPRASIPLGTTAWGFGKMALRYDRGTNFLTVACYLYVPAVGYEDYREGSRNDTEVYTIFNYPDDTNPLGRPTTNDQIRIPLIFASENGHWEAWIRYVLICAIFDDNPSPERPTVVQSPVVLLDPTYFDGEDYIDLITGTHGKPYGGVERVFAEERWVWVIRGWAGDSYVHVLVPPGYAVLLKDSSGRTRVLGNSIVTDGEEVYPYREYKVEPGSYEVAVAIPYVEDPTDGMGFIARAGDAVVFHIWDWEFDGSDDYVDVPHDVALFPEYALTIEAFVNVRSVDARNHIVWQVPVSYPGYSMWIDTDQKLGLEWRDASGTLHIVKTTGTVRLGEWIYCAAVFDYASQTQRLYIDSTLTVARATTDKLGDSGQDLFIGHGAAPYFHGEIAFVRIYDRPLTAEEIQNAYGSRVIPADGLVLYMDPAYNNGTHFYNLANATIAGKAYGGPKLVEAEDKFATVIRGMFDDSYVHVLVPPRVAIAVRNATWAGILYNDGSDGNPIEYPYKDFKLAPGAYVWNVYSGEGIAGIPPRVTPDVTSFIRTLAPWLIIIIFIAVLAALLWTERR